MVVYVLGLSDALCLCLRVPVQSLISDNTLASSEVPDDREHLLESLVGWLVGCAETSEHQGTTNCHLRIWCWSCCSVKHSHNFIFNRKVHHLCVLCEICLWYIGLSFTFRHLFWRRQPELVGFVKSENFPFLIQFSLSFIGLFLKHCWIFWIYTVQIKWTVCFVSRGKTKAIFIFFLSHFLDQK